MNKILIIIGSTSTGKTDLALQLAEKFNGELVSCDSRQIYCGLDIGTGKLPGGRWKVEDGRWKKGKGFWEMDGVKIWMYDVADFKKQYTVYDYVQDAFRVIGEIQERRKLPILVGGTGFYLKALLEGLPNLAVPVDRKLRKKLKDLSLNELQIKLQKHSPEKWGKMNNSDRQNPRRLIRVIEMAVVEPFVSQSVIPANAGIQSEKSSSELDSRLRGNDNFGISPKSFNVLKIGLTVPREILYQRIDERVVERINQGMVDEARKLHESGLSFKRMRQLGLEYGVLADYLEHKISNKEQLIDLLQGKIHGYARRQITWFKNEKGVFWFNITKKGWLDQVESKVNSWYYSLNDQTN